jgi:Tfp pilus assembly protein PilW
LSQTGASGVGLKNPKQVKPMLEKQQKGITLLEVMIATTAGLILLLGTATVLAWSQSFWNQAWRKATLQRDAFNAMLSMTGVTMAGITAAEENDRQSLTIYGRDGWTRFYVQPGANILKCEVQGQQPRTVISSKVEDLRFAVSNSTVDIDLTLMEGVLQIHSVKTVMMRNFTQ